MAPKPRIEEPLDLRSLYKRNREKQKSRSSRSNRKAKLESVNNWISNLVVDGDLLCNGTDIPMPRNHEQRNKRVTPRRKTTNRGGPRNGTMMETLFMAVGNCSGLEYASSSDDDYEVLKVRSRNSRRFQSEDGEESSEDEYKVRKEHRGTVKRLYR